MVSRPSPGLKCTTLTVISSFNIIGSTECLPLKLWRTDVYMNSVDASTSVLFIAEKAELVIVGVGSLIRSLLHSREESFCEQGVIERSVYTHTHTHTHTYSQGALFCSDVLKMIS